MSTILEIVDAEVRRRAATMEAACEEAMREWGCGRDELRIHVNRHDRTFRVVHYGDDERWLDWQSDNHGWGAP